LKESVVSGEEYDDAIIIERFATPGGLGRGILRFLWRSCVKGAAMYGAAAHGFPDPEYFRPNVARQEDKEERIPL
jgi:hypothetical protein